MIRFPLRNARALQGVRDLASGYQLPWLPVRHETAAPATAALEGLIREHVAPRGLESDKGSGVPGNRRGGLAGQLASPATLLSIWLGTPAGTVARMKAGSSRV